MTHRIWKTAGMVLALAACAQAEPATTLPDTPTAPAADRVPDNNDPGVTDRRLEEQLERVRSATARYKDIEKAVQDG